MNLPEVIRETPLRLEDARDYRVAWEHVSAELRKKEKELASVRAALDEALRMYFTAKKLNERLGAKGEQWTNGLN